jgi:hypothetical protein
VKTTDSSRRTFLALGAAAAVAASAKTAQAMGFDEPGIKITFPGGRMDDGTLRFMQQIGVRWITTGGAERADLQRARPSRIGQRRYEYGARSLERGRVARYDGEGGTVGAEDRQLDVA